ncbi:MAG: LacI family DNA-binding transcriptional regulator [Collinsella sp.]
MKDVAELAGVSSAAVSRYLNGGYISADKAERIKHAIELTGYVRSSQARALRTGSTKLIGVIIPKINSESVSRITAGIGQVLGRRGYQMLLANTDNAADRELEYLDLFQNHPVDGIVLVATMITDEHRRAIESCHVPIVLIGQHVEGAACVYHDDYEAAFELGHALGSLGWQDCLHRLRMRTARPVSTVVEVLRPACAPRATARCRLDSPGLVYARLRLWCGA